MITIELYTNATDAYRARELLETNGVHCKLQGDLLSEPEPMGRIELLVEAKDAKLARDVLANSIAGED
ncbi:DUF2007 domain-containing protein [Candidiatus Paracoxiella cheracis]|uniref:DUF2007 domain-containing protein n=1 Tax=Candidiatus Paracoxiella cheracis TaxID=3405120 RepID=UPI003BF5A3E5